MEVLVDSSIWIDYLKRGKYASKIDPLLDENLIVINDLILTELIPLLRLQSEHNLIKLFQALPNRPLEIDWAEIQNLQTHFLQRGINGVGISDIVIIQNAIQNKLVIFSKDKHFHLTQKIAGHDLIDVS